MPHRSKDEWTPVVKRKRKATRVHRSSEDESSDSEVDVSCSRMVEDEKRDGSTWTEDLP